MKTDDKQMVEAAYFRFIERSGMQQGDEPWLMFGFLALENEMLLEKISIVENTLKAFIDHTNKRLGPKLVIPEAGIRLTK